MSIELREVVDEDAASLFALEGAVLAAGVGMVTTAADLHPDAAAYLAHVQATRARGDRAWFVAVDGARALGQVTVTRMRPSLLRHVGVFGVQVHPEAQGRGLGRALMHTAIAWAEAAGLTRLELYTRADNERARRLYASLGFVVEGVRRDFVRLPDGTFVDDLVMARVRSAAQAASRSS